MVISKQMRRWLIKLTVVLAMFSVAANAQCYGKCIVASCDFSSQPVPAENDYPCHQHGNPPAPADGDQACPHPQLFSNDLDRTVVPVPADVVFLAVVPGLGSTEVDLTSPPSVSFLETPPPAFADIVSVTILRV